MNIAILTVSDTRSLEQDVSGSLLVERARNSGHCVQEHVLVRDEKEEIRECLKRWINDAKIQVIISTGGTGLTARDITVDVHKEFYEKIIEGFSTVFHMVSYEKIGVSTIQSRVCAGVASGKLLFALPGSPSACRDAWDEILRYQLDAGFLPCNLAEIIDRLT